MKEIFDKKFVHFMWDDKLDGKEGFFSKDISTLVLNVEAGFDKVSPAVDCVFGVLSKGSYMRPFHSDIGEANWVFFYYDPLYEVKLAWKRGKMIQVRSIKSALPWLDWYGTTWKLDCYEYRIKPEKKWRPFNDIQELKQAWEKKWDPLVHSELVEPIIWVRDKERPDITRLITDFNAGSNSVALAGHWNILEALFEDYTFLDGSPCGVEE